MVLSDIGFEVKQYIVEALEGVSTQGFLIHVDALVGSVFKDEL